MNSFIIKFVIFFIFRYRWNASTTKLLKPVQYPHQKEATDRQQENCDVISESSMLPRKIEMWIDPPRLLPNQVKDKCTHPHPNHVRCHESERLEDFYGVDVEAIIYSDFGEHKAHGNDVHGNVKEHRNGSKHEALFSYHFQDRWIQNSPVDDDDNDVKDKASRVQELQKPQVPW